MWYMLPSWPGPQAKRSWPVGAASSVSEPATRPSGRRARRPDSNAIPRTVMTEQKNPGEKLTVAPTKTLTLKRSVEQGMVRQSFSHGRTKAVVVEKVKRRVVGPGEAKAPEPAAPPPPTGTPPRRTAARPVPAVVAPATPAPAAAPGTAASKPSGVVLRTLTDEERSARAHALADAKVREAEERKIAEEEARRRAARESRERVEREAAEARKRDEDDRRRHDEE